MCVFELQRRAKQANMFVLSGLGSLIGDQTIALLKYAGILEGR